MTTLNEYARPEWAAPRKETWYEHLLPQRVTDTINQSPLVGALSKYMNSPPPDLTLSSQRDSQVPLPRAPSWFDDRPIAAEAVDKAGFLANFFAPGVRLPPQAPKPQGFRAYHGSPHDFDRFDMSKIGTGEGAQAYGRGLYFAEAEDVAKGYRNRLSGGVANTTADLFAPDNLAGKFMANADGDAQKALALITREIEKTKAMPAYSNAANPQNMEYGRNLVRGLEEAAQAISLGNAKVPGRLYEVRINADPETFLDWDKPLSQQPEAVKKVLGYKQSDPRGLSGSVEQDSFGNWITYSNNGEQYVAKTREAALKMLGEPGVGFTHDLRDSKTISAIREAGTPGIKYKDAISRGTDAGTSNYVVFDDKLIEILRKYGLLPPVAAGAAMAQGQEPPL